MSCNHLEYIIYDERRWCRECGIPLGESVQQKQRSKVQPQRSCEGKTFFESEIDIRHWISERRSNLASYKCDTCNGFHLTAGSGPASIR